MFLVNEGEHIRKEAAQRERTPQAASARRRHLQDTIPGHKASHARYRMFKWLQNKQGGTADAFMMMAFVPA